MDTQTEREIVINALNDILEDVRTYSDHHFGQLPLREETIGKVKAALRLITSGE